MNFRDLYKNVSLLWRETWRNSSIVTLSDEILSHLYDLYPVLLRLVPVTETYRILKRPGFLLQIDSITVFKQLLKEIVAYLRATHGGVIS